MTLFYFVRHGKTEINESGCFNGGTVDSPLTKAGKEETAGIAEYLADTEFAKIYSSPLPRAQTTAKIIVEQNKFASVNEITIEDRFREMNLGDWDGTPVESQKNHPEFDHYFHRPDLFDAAAVHAESFQEIIDRGEAALKDITEAYPHDKVMVVSHGLILTFLMNTLLGAPLSKVRELALIDNSSLTILEADEAGNYTCQEWNHSFQIA